MVYRFKVPSAPEISDVEKYYNTFVVPIPDDLRKRLVKANPIDLGDVSLRKIKVVPGSSQKMMFVDNPILTDVTQAEQCNLQHILTGNPDVNGLSLLLDDPAKQELRDTVSIEDFLEPSEYRDIFDIQEFVEHASSQFKLLPAGLRKAFNNDPFELCHQLSSQNPAAFSLLEQYLNPLLPHSESSGTPSVDRDNTLTPEADLPPLKNQSGATENQKSKKE